ncbi:hydrogenase nickel incorporation protein HypB [Paraferrimonas sedimenticola]|uniref:Hydrogenase maturation factor HypB n=1 Tax=Paraferrimonas sedimenticola TaxID=375674 RepID=A0AA37W1E7_9GAMM|nr:hydrogenase nickel incorporation protein HypB [Paraferrimonas sedimenticola]GLP97300.1 hydrogenase accessory protein HypB [Paraferrimonas sedimenticola]
MCTDCGCSLEATKPGQKEDANVHANPQLNDEQTVKMIHKILHKNDHQAEHNREHFERNQVKAYNLMSSPGSGKTTLLESLGQHLDLKFAVVEGDLETNRDADRLIAAGVEAIQIQTGSACHLDAFMVHDGLHHIDLAPLDICFVENVGNLVCPATYDLGTHRNLVLLSVPEGDDKVEKYPVMFRQADAVLVTKTDLMPYFDFSLEEVEKHVRKLNPDAPIFAISVKQPDTLQPLIEWLQQEQKA